MKKVNKMLMTTVAVLLCLVLISTSTVSGIFAKFVIQRQSDIYVSVEQFGLTLTVTGMTGTKFTERNGENVSASISGVSINMNKNNIVQFTLSGTPNVDKVKLVIQVAISGVENFRVAENEISGVPAGIHLPLGFMTKIVPDSIRTSTNSYWICPSTNEDVEKAIIDGIVNDVKDNKGSGTTLNQLYDLYHEDAETGKSTYKIEAVANDKLDMIIWDTEVTNNALTIQNIQFGIRPFNQGTGDTEVTESIKNAKISGFTYNEAAILQTYFAGKTNPPKLTVTYTVSIEQVID